MLKLHAVELSKSYRGRKVVLAFYPGSVKSGAACPTSIMVMLPRLPRFTDAGPPEFRP